MVIKLILIDILNIQVLHTFFTWLLMLKLKWGLAGGAEPVVVGHCGG